MLATYLVTNLADAGAGSLREAIAAANASAGADVIEFAPDLAGGTITLGGTQLEITDDLTINGPGSDLLTISGNDSSRVFSNGLNANTTIRGLTIARGWCDLDQIMPERGGGVLNLGTMTLIDSAIVDNSTTGINNTGTLTLTNSIVSRNSDGGIINTDNFGTPGILSLDRSTVSDNFTAIFGGTAGIDSEWGGTVMLIDSTVSGNTAEGPAVHGGGISIHGTLTLVNSRVVGNRTTWGGGGILIWGGTVTLTDSIVADNRARDSGGGIDNLFGSLTLINSTVSGNVADSEGISTLSSGGGIETYGPLTIINSTISGNTADWGGGISTADTSVMLVNSTVANNVNGGIYATQSNPGVIQSVSSIIANNASTGLRADVYQLLFASGSINNLIGSAGSAGGLIDGIDGNIVGVDPMLGPLADNGGPTQTHALLAGSPAIDLGSNPRSLATDQRGAARELGQGVDIGAFEWGTTSSPRGSSDDDNTHRVVTVNALGHVLVFEEGWTFENLQEKTGSPHAMGAAVIWTDPKDGLTYVAAASQNGLLLFTRSETGAWSFRNLQTETGARASPVRDLTCFVSVRRRIVVIAGITAAGDVVAFRQTLDAASGGGRAFAFVDISADLASQGQATPDLTGLTSYVPSWDTWHLAGIDTHGRIQSIWINTNNPSFTKWRVNDLSAITGAPPIASQLTVTLTSWGGINLTGLDQAGNLLTTWWVPRFGGKWAVSNLTAINSGPALVGGSLTSYTTPWGGINYVGFDAGGTVRVYWWVPSFIGRWAVNPLLPASTPSEMIPTGTLTSSSSARGTLSVYGLNTDGHVLRMSWQPSGSSAWAIEDLTEIAEKV